MGKAKPENQVLRRYQQKCGDDTDLDRTVRLPTYCVHEVSVKNEAFDAADSRNAANQSIRKMVS